MNSNQAGRQVRVGRVQSGLVDDALIVTGAPRSGTTLMGNIVGSFDSVEYFFEPPTFHMLCSLHAAGALDEESGAAMLQAYCCEELLLEAVQGRGVNLRPGDDSLFLKRHSWTELNDRWQQVNGHRQAIDVARSQSRRLAVKMPNSMDGCSLVSSALSRSQFVVMLRDGRDVVSSIVRKGWLSDEKLDSESWPYREVSDRGNIPYWVPDDRVDQWPSMNEASRAVLMWCHHAEASDRFCESMSGERGRCLPVRYEDLVAGAGEVVDSVSAFCNQSPGARTAELVAAIHAPDRSHGKDWQAIEADASDALLETFHRLNAARGYQ